MVSKTVQIRQPVDASVGSSLYGHQFQQQQQQAGSLLHHRYNHPYHQPPAGCHSDRGDTIPRFDAESTVRHQMSPDAAAATAVVLETNLHRAQQRQPGTSFAASRVGPEMVDRACVDRCDYVLLGCDQFPKISYHKHNTCNI